MITRILSGVVLVAILLLVAILGGNVLLIFTIITGLIGLYELYKVLAIYKNKPEDKKDNLLAYAGFIGATVYFVLLAIGGILPKGISLDFNNWDTLFGAFSNFNNLQNILSMSYVNLIFYMIVIMLVVFLGIYVFTFPRFNVEQVTFAFFGIVYVPIFLSFMYMVRCLNGGQYFIWLIFISSWVCDTCAYFVGSAIGKHKLAPVLSPKKSIEGAIGGVLGAALVAFIFGYFVEYKIFGGTNNGIKYVIICSVGAVISQIGDLAASGIKRNKEIKDYGNLIPGHGGILDRFDSVIFASPFIYLLVQGLF